MIVKKLRLILDIQLTLVKSKSAYLERLRVAGTFITAPMNWPP